LLKYLEANPDFDKNEEEQESFEVEDGKLK
jgi:hypothetical protein